MSALEAKRRELAISRARFSTRLCHKADLTATGARPSARDMGDLLLSIVMLGGIALLGGAVFVFRSGDRRRALLMLIAALVMFANVAIWVVPVK